MNDAETRLVIDAVSKLMEHFDSVRVFVTKHDGNSEITIPYTSGAGNFYAQLGQINEWRASQNEIAREDARKPETDNPNEE